MLWPSWDTGLFFHINSIRSPFLTGVMRTITNVDNWIPFILLLAAGLLWLGRTRPADQLSGKGLRKWLNRRNPRIVLLCLIISTGISDQICYHFKHNVERSRPCFDDSISHLVIYRGDVHGNRSFPSAHAANSAALCTTMAIAYPPVAPFAFLLTFLVGLSRIYLGVHFPLDVLTGWSFGLLSAFLVYLIFRKQLDRHGLIGYVNRFRVRQPYEKRIAGSQWKPLELKSLDGYQMTGYLRGSGEYLILMVHGLHGSVDSIAAPAEFFLEMGHSVMLVPLRGHDDHSCPVTTGGPGEVNDVAGAMMFSTGELDYDASRIILYGSSMGGATALKAAGLFGGGIAGVICHGMYRNFFQSANMKLGKVRAWMLKMLLPASSRRGLEVFSPMEYASCIEGEMVFLCGSRDTICPPEICREMAESKGAGYLLLKNAGHPSWSSPRWRKKQVRAAFRLAVEYITCGGNEARIVDESGEFDDFPASCNPTLGREQ